MIIDDDFDKNPLNNEITNLQLLTKREHVQLDVKRLKAVEFCCPLCNHLFSLHGTKLSNAKTARKRGKAEVTLIADVYTSLKRSLTGETL